MDSSRPKKILLIGFFLLETLIVLAIQGSYPKLEPWLWDHRLMNG